MKKEKIFPIKECFIQKKLQYSSHKINIYSRIHNFKATIVKATLVP